MKENTARPIVAVDIGNSRIKLGLFDSPLADILPSPRDTLLIDTEEWDPVEIALWLAPSPPSAFDWVLASVHRQAAARMKQWLSQEAGEACVRHLHHEDLPVVVDLPSPEQVGIDRLLGAVAANRLRPADRSAVVIDLGTAITVDVVSPEGTFCGGAILPGIGLSARALGEYTDLLPDVKISTLDEPPPVLGTSTDEAIASGLFWGAVGAMRMLINKLNSEMSRPPFVVLTGGAASSVADLLDVTELGDAQVHFEAHLVLAGLMLSLDE